MNLVDGKIISDTACDEVLEHLEDRVQATLAKPPLDTNLVINACDQLVRNLDSLQLLDRLPDLGVSPALIDMYLGQLGDMLSAEAINRRLQLELGTDFDKERTLVYTHSQASAAQTVRPLGVLFHITAGNVDGLPFLSLLDGLLTGNINIVKLPKAEGGITVSLLQELFRVEPTLSEYVYVFDYSSKDIQAMARLAEVADAIVVWGGDEAVSAIRRLAHPNTKIIEWGHKLSFAYATIDGATEPALEKLARHICLTNQLFCSSCQGVFLDTDDMGAVYHFCETFLPIFERVCQEEQYALDAATRLFTQAEATLREYQDRIEGKQTENRLFRGEHCSITAYPDSKLETSPMYRSIWVKPLLRDNILKLRPYKSYLQTAGLLCSTQDHAELSQRLVRAGVVKVSDGFELSNYAFGEARDGVFPLRCYTRVVSVQNPE